MATTTTAPTRHRVARTWTEPNYGARCDCGAVGTSTVNALDARRDMELRCTYADVRGQMTAADLASEPGRRFQPVRGGETIRTRMWADGGLS